MRFSFSTVYTTVLTSNILFVLAAFILCRKSVLFKIGYKFLGVIFAFAILRLALPLEFPFTQTVQLPEWISILILKFHYVLFYIAGHKVTPWVLLCAVWICGIIFLLFRFVRECFLMRSYVFAYGEDVTEEPLYASVLSKVSGRTTRRISLRIIKLPGIDSPMLYRLFSPCILLPFQMDFSEKELYYVLSHEVSHYLHSDILLKYVLRIITILYWWNPACYVLKRRTELLFEMRIDDTIANSKTDSAQEYLNCLLRIAECATEDAKLPSSLCISFGSKDATNLTKRFAMLLENPKKPSRPMRVGLTVVTLLLCLISYLFILEASYRIPEHVEDNFALSIENTYFIQNENGAYDLYFEGLYIETVDSLENYSKDIPIYQSKEEFTHETEN